MIKRLLTICLVLLFCAGIAAAEDVVIDGKTVQLSSQTTYKVEGLNFKRKILYVRVDRELTDGSKASTQKFGELMLEILNKLPEDWRVFTTNKWTPAAKKVIDREFAKRFVEGY